MTDYVASRPFALSPGRIVGMYVTTGLAWILLSDTLLSGRLNDVRQYRDLAVVKGSLFVIVTAAALFLVIRYYSREVRRGRDIFYKAFQASPDSIHINRLSDGVFLHVNNGFCRMSGYGEGEVIGRTPRQIELWHTPEDQRDLAARLKRYGFVDNRQVTFRTKEGTPVTGLLTVRIIELNGDQCLISIVRDITDRIRAAEEIRQLAYYDAETALPNQHLFMDRLNQVIALDNREQRSSAVICVGLSGFTSIVDVLGHGGSGDVARALAERLRPILRQSDTLARISRDEFAIVLGNAAVDADITMALHKVRAIFEEPLRTGQGELMLTAAIGVACFPSDGLTAEILLQNAHIAMNQAREQASASFNFFSAALNTKALERHRIETTMLRGLEQGEFFLCFQPKFAIPDRAITGMEALVRWERPGIGMIPPDRFIPVAEENGMIIKLGEWVLRSACRRNRAWQEQGLPALRVSVNISARQVRDNGFVAMVTSVLAETGLSPLNLELELTESVVMSDSDDIVYKLLQLRELGVSISVDDFGTGYSSLSYLKHLPIDVLKIDRSFVMDIASDPDDAAIVTAVIAMAHSLNLRVIAEGVETGEQLAFLGERNCDEAQGYYFAKPLEAAQFEEFIRGIEAGKDSGTIGSAGVAPAPPAVMGITLRQEPSGSGGTGPAAPSPVERIGDISTPTAPVHPGDNLSRVLQRFQTNKELLVLPVVDDGQVEGIVNRSTFLEEHVIGRHGFGFHINHSKKIRDLMSPVALTLEADTPIEDAARAIQTLEAGFRADNMCVTRNGRYEGIVDVNRFIGAMTEINLTLAKGANPLTGLPGNESIQRVINDNLSAGKPFDIAYIDIDNFKPYNDYYGFQRGDVVIKALAEVIVAVVEGSGCRGSGFYGHIGGDDFILISSPNSAAAMANGIIREFEGHLPVFHGENDYRAGGYAAINRKGQEETFGLLSLSIGILNTLAMPVASYAQLASLATEVKKAAKRQPGSSVVINKRTNNCGSCPAVRNPAAGPADPSEKGSILLHGEDAT
ncbi:MAG TPA: EAL domain-containing protein [Desulfuromonadaceae bacterium]